MTDLSSPPGTPVTITHQPTGPWLKDPRDPTRNVPLSCLDSLAWKRSRGQAVLEPLGRADPVIQTDVRRSRSGDVGVTVASQDELDQLDALLDTPTVLLLQQPAVAAGWAGQHIYLQVVGDDSNETLGQVPLDNRTLSFSVREVRRPA